MSLFLWRKKKFFLFEEGPQTAQRLSFVVLFSFIYTLPKDSARPRRGSARCPHPAAGSAARLPPVGRVLLWMPGWPRGVHPNPHRGAIRLLGWMLGGCMKVKSSAPWCAGPCQGAQAEHTPLVWTSACRWKPFLSFLFGFCARVARRVHPHPRGAIPPAGWDVRHL